MIFNKEIEDKMFSTIKKNIANNIDNLNMFIFIVSKNTFELVIHQIVSQQVTHRLPLPLLFAPNRLSSPK